MKLFYRIVLILVLPLFIIGSINYLVDPDYTLRKDYIPRIASSLVNGKLLSGPINANGRLLKKEWIKRMEQNPDVLILGSSRTMGVSKSLFPGKKFFNASVSNCTFQDMYAFVDLIEEKQGRFPNEIIICCDQWLLGNSFSEERWLSNRENFISLLKKTGKVSSRKFSSKWELQKEWIKELFSVKYLVRSFKQIKKKEQFEIQNTIIPGKAMLLPDGSRLLPAQVFEAGPEEVDKKAKDYFYTSRDEMFSRLDSLQCQLLENLILYLQKKNCKLTLFIPPYHPLTWQLLHQSEKHAGIFKVDGYLLKLADKYQINLIGATNPSLLNFTSDDFYDAVHLKTEALSQLISVSNNVFSHHPAAKIH